MIKIILCSFMAVFYFSVPMCIMGVLGAAVSKKYEVDQAYWMYGEHSKFSKAESKKAVEELDREGEKFDRRIKWFTIGGFAGFALGTVLLLHIVSAGKLFTGQRKNIAT